MKPTMIVPIIDMIPIGRPPVMMLGQGRLVPDIDLALRPLNRGHASTNGHPISVRIAPGRATKGEGRRKAAMNTTWKRKLGTVAVAAIAVWPAAGKADCRAVSPNYTVALLEFYTSEGCDSCPPADRWFSSLHLGPDAPHAAALAFHVDYWDRLGWRDRFGSAAFTQRQQEQMRRHDASMVYTPQVLLQGNDLTTWRSAPQPTRALTLI